MTNNSIIKKTYNDGAIEFYNSKGKYHRENGPAYIWNRGQSWIVDGQSHRIDGPSIIYNDGNKYWYLFDRIIRMFIYD